MKSTRLYRERIGILREGEPRTPATETYRKYREIERGVLQVEAKVR